MKRYREGIRDNHFEVWILIQGSLGRVDVITAIQGDFTGSQHRKIACVAPAPNWIVLFDFAREAQKFLRSPSWREPS
jgi:hypothetical protein